MTHTYRNCPKKASAVITRVAAAITDDNSDVVAESMESIQLSFIRRSLVPHVQVGCLSDTGCRGMGNVKLMSCGQVTGVIKHNNESIVHKLIIIPDDVLPIPMLLGRDFLRKANI